jgi:hypothetical protein
MNAIETLSFTQAVAWNEIGPGVAKGIAVADWGQERSTYGGLVAAIAFRQMQREVDARRPSRSLTVTFTGPLKPGEGTCRTRVLRAGKGRNLGRGPGRAGSGVVLRSPRRVCERAPVDRPAYPAAPSCPYAAGYRVHNHIRETRQPATESG